MKNIAKNLGVNYITFDDTIILNTAKNFSDKFFELFKLPLVIDEVQKAPEIIPQLKIILDKTNTTGQVLLTGSELYKNI